MCLTVDEGLTEQLKEIAPAEIVVYKVLKEKEGKYYTPFMGFPVSDSQECRAWSNYNISPREIHAYGVHFYLFLDVAKAIVSDLGSDSDFRYFVIRMTVKKEDFIAVGTNHDIAVRRCVYPANIAESIVH